MASMTAETANPQSHDFAFERWVERAYARQVTVQVL